MRSIGMATALMLAVAGCSEAGGGHTDYGAGVKDTSNLVAISAIVADPATFDGQTVTVKGVIASVCPSSGCFMRLGAGTSQIHVDFVESGFTLPPDKNGGKVAFAQGTVHAGDDPQIAASGVRILEK